MGVIGTEPEVAAQLQGGSRRMMMASHQGRADSLGAQVAQSTGERATPVPASSGGIILEWRRQTTGILREQLGEERFRWLRSQGEAMDDDQIVTVALDVIDKVRARASLYSDPED